MVRPFYNPSITLPTIGGISMLRVENVIEDVHTSILEPVTDQIVNKIVRELDIGRYVGNRIYINSDTRGGFSSADANNNPILKENRLTVNMTYNLNPWAPKYPTTTFFNLVSGTDALRYVHETKPTFMDLRTQVTLVEKEIPCDITMEFRLSFTDRVLAAAAFSKLTRLWCNGEMMFMDDLRFEYPVPERVYTYLFGTYKMLVVPKDYTVKARRVGTTPVNTSVSTVLPVEDGITINVGDSILAIDSSTPGDADKAIYTLTSVSSTSWRYQKVDIAGGFNKTIVMVEQGKTYAGNLYRISGGWNSTTSLGSPITFYAYNSNTPLTTEKVYDISPSNFLEYLEKFSDQRVTTRVNRNSPDGSKQIVVNKNASRMLVSISYDAASPEISANNKSADLYTLVFTVVAQFSRPDMMILTYPIVICNQLVPEYLLSVDLNDFEKSPEESHPYFSFDNYAKAEGLNEQVQDVVNIPFYDEWVPQQSSPVRVNGYKEFLTCLFTLDDITNPTAVTTLDIENDLPISLAPQVIAILKDQGSASLFFGKALHVSVFVNESMIEPTSLTLTGGTVLRVPNRYPNAVYRLVISENKELTDAVYTAARILEFDIIAERQR
jgi:hypothetical protein